MKFLAFVQMYPTWLRSTDKTFESELKNVWNFNKKHDNPNSKIISFGLSDAW